MNPALKAVVASCHTTDLDGKDAPFTALVRLAADGHVQEILVSPANPFSTCVQAGLKKRMFPGAPWEGYWLEIKM